MTVEIQLKQLEARRAQIRATPCAGCGHPYANHNDRCAWPLIPNGDPRCICRQFIDPAETTT